MRERLEREKREIEEEERRKKIERAELDSKLENSQEVAKVGGWGFLGSLALGISGALITPFCPVAGVAMIGGAIGGGTTFGAEFVGGKIAGSIYQHKKNKI